MKRGAAIGLIVVAVIVVLALVLATNPLTANVTYISSVQGNYWSCIDSDAGPSLESHMTEGTVTRTSSSGLTVISYTDSCRSKIAYEYYCSSNAGAKLRKVICDNGCIDGHCIP